MLALLSFLATLYFIYLAIFYGWMTAAPRHSSLAVNQFYTYVAASLIAPIIGTAFLVRALKIKSK